VSPKQSVPNETMHYPERKTPQIVRTFAAKWKDIFTLWQSRNSTPSSDVSSLVFLLRTKLSQNFILFKDPSYPQFKISVYA
jgi:hypothetical protein